MSADVRTVEVAAPFRHSAGRLGTHFLRALRDDSQVLGWRAGTPARTIVPPKDLGGAGEWVPVGPGATLAAYAPADWLAEIGVTEDATLAGSVLALVTLDGADTALLARLRPGTEEPRPGMRLAARFADRRVGAVTDFWFEPARD